MRVALLSHNARYGDAIGRQVAAKAAFFRDRGADVRVYVECAQQLHPVLDPFVQIIAGQAALEPLAAEIRSCDLACVEFGQHYRLAEVLPLLAGGRVRVLFDYHGVTPPEYAAGNGEALRAGQRWRALAWYADEVAVHSRFMQNELGAATGLPASRMVVAPLRIATTSNSYSSSRYLHQRTGQANAQFALFVGRVAPNKRLPVLIEALAQLHAHQPKLHVAIVGNNSGAYAAEAERCQELAEQLGLRARVHFLGSIADADLAGAYASADLFVMPSVHEGFCMPVMEALEHGLPVVAARAGALPEALAGAGLLFEPDDANDLAGQMRRLLNAPVAASDTRPARRLAIVSTRFGADVLGGAERSLRTMARVLAASGWEIEVFTTGAADSYHVDAGMRIWQFAAEPSADVAQAAALGAVATTPALAHSYFERSPNARGLLQQLQARADEFAAFITGPYGSGLAWRVAQLLPNKTIVAPCFHAEPLARTQAVRSAYSNVAGFLFHSHAERELAEVELGMSHPNAEVVGSFLEPGLAVPRPFALEHPYLLYAGRYCQEKNLPLLIDWQRRYESEKPGRFQFVCMGMGNVPIPSERPWHDLGFVPEAKKAAVMAGAAALVQLSCHESLSLVTLEAWQQGVPVIAQRQCAAVAGMVDQVSGGAVVASYDDFRACLDDLHDRPEVWRELGQQGRAWVQREFEARDAFAERITTVIEGSAVALADQLRQRGRQRAACFAPDVWEQFFAAQVDRVLHQEPMRLAERATIRPRRGDTGFRARLASRKLAVEITNHGSVPIAAALPQAALVWSLVLSTNEELAAPPLATPVVDWLNPGQARPMFVRMRFPAAAGEYRVGFVLQHEGEPMPTAANCAEMFPLHLEEAAPLENDDALLTRVRAALGDVERLQHLPDGYTDVSTGPLAKVKQRLKQKLLHQFKTAYVDVLSRQQSDWNRQVVAVLQELTESIALLEQSAVDGATGEPAADLARLTARLQRGVRSAVGRIEALEIRLERLEALSRQQSPARTQE